MVSIVSACVAILSYFVAYAGADVKTITGLVTDIDGTPVAGAMVEWGLLDAEAGDRERTYTEADGRYALPVERYGAGYRLAISKDGYAPQYWVAGAPWIHVGEPASDADTLPPAEQDAVLEPAHWIDGVVTGEDGTPVAGAVIAASTAVEGFHSSFSMPSYAMPLPGSDRELVTTDADGVFRLDNLPAGRVQVHVEAPHRWLNDKNYDVDNHHEFVMAGSGVPGQVRIQAVNGDSGEPVTVVCATIRHGAPTMPMSNEDGVYLLGQELTAGREYTVQIYARGYAPWRGEIAAAKLAYSLVPKIALKPSPTFEGRLVSAATGEPIVNAEVLYAVNDGALYVEWSEWPDLADGHYGLEMVQRASTDERGRFSLSDEAGHPGVLLVYTAGFARTVVLASQRPAPDASGMVTIPVEPEAVVRGTVDIGALGYVPDGVSVWRTTDNDSPRDSYETVQVGLNGNFEIGRLRAGKYGLSVVRPLSHFTKSMETLLQFTVKSGEAMILDRVAPGIDTSTIF
ncbi:MAG: hypothetical protein AMXMBFR84_19500 [Candidatus Hydrogenedentota bacterium]